MSSSIFLIRTNHACVSAEAPKHARLFSAPDWDSELKTIKHEEHENRKISIHYNTGRDLEQIIEQLGTYYTDENNQLKIPLGGPAPLPVYETKVCTERDYEGTFVRLTDTKYNGHYVWGIVNEKRRSWCCCRR